ncbi:MAG: phage tail tape measure protein [Oligoflexales bacterium]
MPKKVAFAISAKDKEALASIRKLTAGFDKLIKPLDKINARLRANFRALGPMLRRLDQFEDKLKGLGKDLSMRLTLPVATFGAVGLKVASDFESAMKKVGAISGATEADLVKMSEAAKRFGATTQFSQHQIAEGLLSLSYAGYGTAEKLKMIPGILDLAAISGNELGEVGEFATNIMAGFGEQAENFAAIADKITYGFTHTKTDFINFHDALSKVAGVAKSVNVTFNQTAGTIMALAKMGHKGPEAGTALASSLMRIINLTPEAQLALSKLGVYKEDVLFTQGKNKGKIKDLIGFLELLKSKKATTDVYVKIFGADPAKYLLSVVDKIDLIREYMDGLANDSFGLASKKAKEMMESFEGSLKLLQSASEGFVNKFFESGPLQFFTALGDSAAILMQRLEALSSETHNMLGIFAGIAAIAGPIVIGISGLVAAFAGLVKLGVAASIGGILSGFALIALQVTGVIAAFAGLVYGGFLLIKNWDYIAEAAVSLWASFRENMPHLASFFESIVGGVIAIGQSIWEGIKDIGASLYALYETFIDSDFFRMIKGVGSILLDGILTAVGRLGTVLGAIFSKVAQGITWLITGLVKYLSERIKGVFDSLRYLLDGLLNNRLTKYLADKIASAAESGAEDRRKYLPTQNMSAKTSKEFAWAPDFLADPFKKAFSPDNAKTPNDVYMERFLSLLGSQNSSNRRIGDRGVYHPQSMKESFADFIRAQKQEEKKQSIDLNFSFDNLPMGISVAAKSNTGGKINFNHGLLMEGSY